MKRNLCMLALAGLMTLALAACGGEEPAPQAQAGQEAVGAIFVPGGADLPEGKVYAQFADREYTFALDAAWVYYFDTVEGTEPVAYAGDGNLTQLTSTAAGWGPWAPGSSARGRRTTWPPIISAGTRRGCISTPPSPLTPPP